MKKIFIRCGDRTLPDSDYLDIALPQFINKDDLPEIVAKVNKALEGVKEAEIVIAGPVMLGAALGYALGHLPCLVHFVQLNQQTKEYERWFSTNAHL